MNLSFDPMGFITGVYNIFANERARQDQLSQQDTTNMLAQRQQDFAEATTRWNQNFAYEERARQDTQYQRRAADLAAAGLHPTLAVSGGGVSPPMGGVQGGHGGMPPAHQSSNRGIQAGQVYMSALMGEQLRNLQAQTAEARSRSELFLAQAEAARGTETRAVELHPHHLAQHNAQLERHGVDMQLLNAELQRAPHEFSRVLLQNIHIAAQTDQVRAQTDAIRQQVNESVMVTLRHSQEAMLHQLRRQSLELEQLSLSMGISRNELENRLLAHDADIMLGGVAPTSERTMIDSFISTLGLDARRNNFAVRLLRGILMYGDWASDTLIRARGLNQRQYHRSR